VILGVVVLMFGTLAVLGALSFRRFVGASKQAEVKNCLGQIAKDSASAYEREAVDQEEIVRRVCPSASRPVPADASLISGKKYQSTPADWQVDKARDAGFACLRFEMTAPQYYQYRYEATPTSFVAGGRGDLNGNGKYSDFTIKGEIKDTRLILTPSIDETDPDE
jgi:type II secretory pathway pseudopilin PulG